MWTWLGRTDGKGAAGAEMQRAGMVGCDQPGPLCPRAVHLDDCWAPRAFGRWVRLGANPRRGSGPGAGRDAADGIVRCSPSAGLLPVRLVRGEDDRRLNRSAGSGGPSTSAGSYADEPTQPRQLSCCRRAPSSTSVTGCPAPWSSAARAWMWFHPTVPTRHVASWHMALTGPSDPAR